MESPKQPVTRKRNPARARLPLGLRRRGWLLAGLAVVIGFSYLAYRLFQIQIVDGEHYRQLAIEQQMKDSVIEAERGVIYDATGKVLASSSIVWDLSCDPLDSKGLSKVVNKETGERMLVEKVCREVSTGVARILVANDGSDGAKVDLNSPEYLEMYDKVYKAFSQIDKQYRLLARKVDLPVSDAVMRFVDNYSKANKENGVDIVVTSTKSYKRNYPYGAFAGAAIGFCDMEGEGTYGLEKSYDDVLAGVDGRSLAVTDANRNILDTENALVHEPQHGHSIVSTLDTNVQEVVERYLSEAVKANNVGNRGTALVMNANTGAILAMASKPDFDPNEPNLVYDLPYMQAMVQAEPELYQAWEKDEDGHYILDEQGNKIPDLDYDYTGIFREMQRKNKAITELYYPGSVFKAIVGASGVDSGAITDQTIFTCTGSYQVADRQYHCAGRKRHGSLNLWNALRYSCNLYFIQTAEAMGPHTYFDYFQAFGFTEPTGIDLPYETSYVQYYKEKDLGPVELASSAFGQSMKITPLQMCVAMAACVNGGYLVQPYMVSEVIDSAGNIVEQHQRTVRRQILSEETSKIMREMLEYEVGDANSKGGGHRAFVAGYRVGGKSGTSEQLDMDRRASDGDYKKVASFCATFPSNDPEYIVFIMLDDPNNASSDFSSVLAAPVVGNIISEIAPYLGVPTSGEDLKSTTVKVPYLIGQEWGNAQVALNRAGLKHRLVTGPEDATAAPVTYQYPTPNTKVSGGTTVYLYVAGAEPAKVVVPDVTGHTVDFAQQRLSSAGLNYLIQGDPGGIVAEQSVAAGDEVQMGTVVKLQCITPDPPPIANDEENPQPDEVLPDAGKDIPQQATVPLEEKPAEP